MHAASVSDPFHNNVSVSPVHGSWESVDGRGCVRAYQGGREGRGPRRGRQAAAGGAVAGRGMARPLHDDDDDGDDDELHRVPQAKITN